MSQDNIEALRRAYEALNRGDVDAVLQVCDPDVECQLPEGGVTTGTLRGHQALKSFLMDYIESFESFRLDPEQFLDAGGDRVVVLLRVSGRGRGSGLEVSTRPAHLWTLKDGIGLRVDVFADGEHESALESAGLTR